MSQHQFDAPAKTGAHMMPLAADDDRARLPRMFLKPFRSWPAHVMQLGPVSVGKVPHRKCPYRLGLRAMSGSSLAPRGLPTRLARRTRADFRESGLTAHWRAVSARAYCNRLVNKS